MDTTLDRQIVAAIGIAAETTATRLSEHAQEGMARSLSRWPRGLVLTAVHRAMAEVRPGQLVLSAILERLEDGHPSPEAAWAMVAGLDDEGVSVVWTDEIARAYAVARGALPDRVAARLAFQDAYRREVHDARATARPPHWWPCLGWDAAGRQTVLDEAVAKGRLPGAVAAKMLPPASGAALPENAEVAREARALVEGLARRLTAETIARGKAAVDDGPFWDAVDPHRRDTPTG